MDAGGGPGSSRVPWLAALGVIAGLAARLALCFQKPLWADEIFTLALARQPAARILEALRLDSGPPLHYLLAKMALLPFADPGAGDVAVRLISLAAALLHVPLLLAVARRLGRAESGWRSAALYSLFPIAVSYGAEGRSYAVASLLVLAAFERSLAVRQRPAPLAAAAAGALAGAALLTHYLALFPLAGIALALLAGAGPRRYHLLSGGVAALLGAAWLPVALVQPRASMAWTAGFPAAGGVSRLVAGLLVGVDDGGGALPFLLSGALVVLGALLLAARRGDLPSAAVVAGGALLFLAGLAVPEILLPERAAVAFLPLTALALGGNGGLWKTASGAAAAFLLLKAPAWARTSPGEELAAHLLAPVRQGAHVAAVGLWGPELAYRMAAAGQPGAVTLFPSTVARHPGWYTETELPPDRVALEARDLLEKGRPGDLYVLPRGSLASQVLRMEVAGAGAARVGATPFLEVYRLGGGKGRSGEAR